MEESINLSGRVEEIPDEALYQLILKPQFDYERANLLPFYLWLEKVYVKESIALGILTLADGQRITSALDQISADNLQADLTHNLSDISFAIEQKVIEIIQTPVATWHVDKSRNDFQACAQRMFARQHLLDQAQVLAHLSERFIEKAEQTVHLPMPGYTHYQAAQIISPGFYLAAVNEAVLGSVRCFLNVYQELNLCPLGAGAMAGLELSWDRQQIAQELGFDAPACSALGSVAERSWTLQISFEYALLGTVLSRFCTGLSLWGSSEYGFIDFPDALVGISSAMPQKRNFTLLERIRGETAHLASLHLDFLLGQRNTPYTNLVEVSKEAGRYLLPLFQHGHHIAVLLTLLVTHLNFLPERMQAVCERDYYGGFALANALCLQDALPYRTAQGIAGEFIRLAIARQIPPTRLSITMLREIVERYGHHLSLSEPQLHKLFDVTEGLEGKRSAGSTHGGCSGTLSRTDDWASGSPESRRGLCTA